MAVPTKSLGFGNWSSLTNLNRESLTMYRPVCPPEVRFPMMPVPGGLETFLVGLGLVEPPPPLDERTKLLGSSREERMAGGMLERTEADEDVCERDGGGGAGADAGGGGGGGGAGAARGGLGALERDGAGDVLRAGAAARTAAWTAMLFEWPPEPEGGGGGGGGGAGDRAGAGGSFGAAIGGGGGGAGGAEGGDEGGGGGGGAGAPGNGGGADGADEDGLRFTGGGGGFLPIGGGGPFMDADDEGRGLSLLPVFLKFATDGWKEDVLGALGRPGMEGAAPDGGFGADMAGGFGIDVRDDSGSER